MLLVKKKPQSLDLDRSRITLNENCFCHLIINPQAPHQCQRCKKKISACQYTNELQHKITLQAIEIESLKKELETSMSEIRRQKQAYESLQSKYMVDMELVNQQKEQVANEIEELSTKLFEEANIMVANEKKKTTQLELMLQRTEDQLNVEQKQLQELKSRVEDIVSPTQNEPFFQKMINLDNNQQDLPPDNNIESNKKENVYSNTRKRIYIDPGLSSIRLFQSYIDEFTNTVATYNENELCNSDSSITLFYSSDQQSTIIKVSEYIQLCEKEDIEPCLQFGISATRMLTKVMMEYMLQKPCFIESITIKDAKKMVPANNSVAIYRPFWERITGNATTLENCEVECVACKRTYDLQNQEEKFYRFRLDEQDDWLLIDNGCRNRLVAVCNLYSFLRNIQLGYYQHRSFKDLYAENIELRMQIFYARMGLF